MFLKDKADGMHRAGNYRAAVNAYTKAIQIDVGMTVCYSNRAASYLKLKEFRQACRPCMLGRSGCHSCVCKLTETSLTKEHTRYSLLICC